jgi:hypothetical protein
MKKGSKKTDIDYFLEIRKLDNKPIHLTSGKSLRSILKIAAEYVPTMNTYSKVYREMRNTLGIYLGVFVVASPGQRPYPVVVQIVPSEISEADYQRWNERAEKLPPFVLSEHLPVGSSS